MVRVVKKAWGGEYVGHELALGSLDALRFQQSIGFVSQRKCAICVPKGKAGKPPIDHGMADEVISIEPAGDSPVYDLEIDGTHVFDAGGIKVHNCFLSSGRPVFNADGMLRLEKLSQTAKPKNGCLDAALAGKLFRVDEQDGWMTVWEDPIWGCSYIAALDTARGEQAAGAKDPDCHSFVVLRMPYTDANGVLQRTRLVARLRHPCRWDATIAAQKAALIAEWYGGCMIVPEVNQGLDVLEALKQAGATIYRRQKFDRVNPGQMLEILGWETTPETRPMIVSALCDAVREQTIDIECSNAVKEFRTFVRDSRGKACAKSGSHDDDVMAIGIALMCADMASVKIPPQVQVFPQYVGVGGPVNLNQPNVHPFGGACS